ncbi:hypothetical protein [Mycobacterium tuberculosis]
MRELRGKKAKIKEKR